MKNRQRFVTTSFLITFAITPIAVNAEPKISKTHSHNGRTHTHVLPKEGLKHTHNKGSARRHSPRENSQAKNKCSPLPKKYQGQQYGAVLYVLEGSCHRTLSSKERLFVAGVSQQLLNQCQYPTNIAKRTKLINFLSSSSWAVAAGTDYSNAKVTGAMGDQLQSSFSFAGGIEYVRTLGCNSTSRRLANNIVKYVERSTSGPRTGKGWVAGCADYYSGQYSKAQCQCVADLGRAVMPGIHQQRFTRYSMQTIIKRNPFIGLQISMQCRIGNY